MKLNYKQIAENYPSITLRKFCETTGLCYQYLLKLSKQPIANQPYDPTAFNYEAVQRIIDKRQPALDFDSYNWSEIEAAAINSRNTNNSTNVTTLKQSDFVLADGAIQFTLRSNPNTYFTIYTNDSNIVFGDMNSDDIRVMNWNTFLHQGPRILLTTDLTNSTTPINPASSTTTNTNDDPTNTTEAEPVATSAGTLASDPGESKDRQDQKAH